MQKNLIALAVLVLLGLGSYFALREVPDEEQRETQRLIEPVDVTRADRLTVLRHEGSGSTLTEELNQLEKAGDRWNLVKPVAYRADKNAVASMLAALGSLKVIDAISESAAKHRVLEVDDELGIDVTAHDGDTELAHLIVGLSREGFTYVRLPGSDTVYRTRGAYRLTFNQPTRALRDRTVLDIPLETITGVTYVEGGKELVLTRGPAGPDGGVAGFDPRGTDIPNFDNERAVAGARLLSGLGATDFVDGPVAEETTGLGAGAPRVKITHTAKGSPEAVTVWVGKKHERGRLTYLKTSLADQIFLVSNHLVSGLKADAEDFERTDAEVAEEAKLRAEAAEHAEAHRRFHEAKEKALEAQEHEHGHEHGHEPHPPH